MPSSAFPISKSTDLKSKSGSYGEIKSWEIPQEYGLLALLAKISGGP